MEIGGSLGLLASQASRNDKLQVQSETLPQKKRERAIWQDTLDWIGLWLHYGCAQISAILCVYVSMCVRARSHLRKDRAT